MSCAPRLRGTCRGGAETGRYATILFTCTGANPPCWLQMPSARGKTPHMIDLLRFVSGLATDLVRRHGELIAENALLRQQLIRAVPQSAHEAKVHGQVDEADKAAQHHGKMDRRRAERADPDRIAKREIEVGGLTEGTRCRQHTERDADLQGEPTTIVPDATERPDEEHGPNHVEEGQQPHGERDLLAPHVLRATDQMLAREQAPADVEVPHQVDHDGRDGLARKEERAAEPESCAGQDDGDVAEVKEVGPAPDRGVSGTQTASHATAAQRIRGNARGPIAAGSSSETRRQRLRARTRM